MKKLISFLVVIVTTITLYAQTTYYVNDNSTSNDAFTTNVGNDANNGTASSPFATIQHAADVATEGSIIYIDAGVYFEQVTLAKGLSLTGVNSGATIVVKPAVINPPPGSFTEPGTIQTAQNIGDVYIRDMSVTGDDNGVTPIVLQTGGSVKYCRLIGGNQGIFFRVDPAIKTAVIENNYINVQYIGINCQGSGLTASLSYNTIDLNNPFFAAGVFAGLDFGPLVRFTAFGNIINNYNAQGFLANSYNTNITQNSILGTGQHAIEQATNSLGLATCNWFGTTNAATIASKVSGLFSYTPYLTNGANAIVNNGSGGFVPVAGSCGEGVNNFYVNDNSRINDVFTTAIGSNSNNGTSAAPFATLSYAISVAPANSVIHVDAGTYTEQVTTSKGITISGAGQNLTSILKPVVTTAPPGTFTEQGVIQTAQGITGDVNISNLSVTGDLATGVTPIIIQSGGSVKNCKLQGGNQGIFVRVDPAINAAAKTFVIDNNIINAEYIGVNFSGTNLTSTLTNNDINVFNPGFSTGVFAGGDFGSLPNFTATGNKFSSYVTNAIYIQAINNSVTQNSFTGAGTVAIQKVGGNTVNATCNWFGSADGAVVRTRTAGGANYTPWLTNGTDNSTATGFQSTPGACGGYSRLYVNDGVQTGDVFTTAVGNDGNNGTQAAPFATLSKAYVTAQPGDTIYMDAGSYTNIGGTVGKSLTIRGANYLVSPNDVTDPLTAGSRNAETIINTSAFTIGASNVTFSGFTFNPQTASQFVQTNGGLGFDNVTLSKNIFRINSGNNIINITGRQVTPVVTLNYSITDNRFIKEDANAGVAINIRGINGIVIQKNTFTVLNDAANRTETCMNLGNFRSDNVVINNNTAYRQNFMIQGMASLNARVDFNTVKECFRLGILSNNLSEPSVIDISDNIVTDPKGGAPSISYARNLGTILTSPNIARIERNTVTVNATGATVLPQALIAPTLDGNTQNCTVYIRDNKLKITGDFSSMASPTDFVAGIRFLNNSRQSVTERNEIEFSGSNFNPVNKAGIAIYHSGLTPGTNFDIFNNKITGFPTSLEIQNQANGNYGELPNGVTVNFNNNSATSDVLSINNGTTSQDINATCNWYGSAAAQNIINKLTISNIQAVPYLTNGADNDAATGFQPVPNSCDGYPTLITLNGFTNITCNGAANGTISITTTYGKTPFTYTWTKDGDTNFVSHDEDPTGLAPGTYRLAVVDGNGSNIYFTAINADGPGTLEVIITEPVILSASATGTNNSCFNGTTGSAKVIPAGGTAPYTYLWNNGATTNEITNLSAGIYSVTVTDSNACTTTASYEITQPSLLTATANGTNVNCFNGTNGTATVVAAGGTPPYTYLWSNGATTSSISNLTAGIYAVTVTDANGCTATSSYEVTEPSLLTANASGTNVSCYNGSNGSASVTPAGGTPPYIYLWSNGAATSSISNLTAATYSVTVTDASGCTTTVSYQVTQPSLLTVTMTGTTASCNGSSTATPAGGIAPYTYLWSNGATTQTISNVPAGTYSVTVKDANNCTVSGSFTITGNSSINPTTSLVPVSCFGGNNGSITVTGSGGTAPFTYNLNGSVFQSSNVFSNLTAGVYIVGVKDATGCSDFVTRTITQPALLTAVLDSTRNTCFGTNSGRIFVTVSGGTGTKTYSWSGPNGYTSTALSPNNLVAGNYTLLVTDTKGCTATLNATVNSFGEIVVASSITNVLCRGSLTGAINLTVSGGTGNGFTYSWTGAVTSTSEDLSNIGASANYNVRITDIGSGCFVNRTFAVTQPAANLSVSATSTNVAGCISLGTVTATGAGGTAPYSYNINGGAYQPSGSFTGLSAGSYSIGIRDANGCTASTARTITDNGSDAYESNNSRNQSKPISIGTTINARIALATDIADWFTFTTPAGGGPVTYSLIVTHPSVNYTFDLYPGTGNGSAITPSAVISSTRKDYLLAPGTAYRISVTSATLSYVCYNLSIAPAIPVTARITLYPAIQKETNKVIVTDVLRSAVYPNPHRGSFTLRIESPVSGEAIVELISVTGQRIEQRKIIVTKGADNIVRFTNMHQPALIYRVTVGAEVKIGKIIAAD